LSEPAPPPQEGSPAPDFELRSQHGEPTKLSAFRGGKSVIVLFYPFAFSGICSAELGEIRDDLGSFQNDDVQVLAVSCDPVHSLRAFAEAEGYSFPLLSDFWPHGDVARAYGVFHPKTGSAVRGSFLVDSAGIVRWSVVNGMGQARELAGYRAALASLQPNR
jgi:peroxiredoxin (alkyl hydroperoxide reductase subunit C)